MNRIRSCTAAILALLVLAMPLAVAAQDEETGREFVFLAGSQFQLVKDGAFDYYSDEDWLPVANVALEVEILDDLFVGIGLTQALKEAWIWETYQTSLRFTQPQVLIRKGFEIADGLRPYVSAAGGYAWSESTITLDSTNDLHREDGWTNGRIAGRAAAGIEAFLPRSIFREGANASGFFKDFTLGVAFELGYAYMQPVDLSDHVPTNDGSDAAGEAMPQAVVDMGELSLQGFYMAFDFRFYL